MEPDGLLLLLREASELRDTLPHALLLGVPPPPMGEKLPLEERSGEAEADGQLDEESVVETLCEAPPRAKSEGEVVTLVDEQPETECDARAEAEL